MRKLIKRIELAINGAGVGYSIESVAAPQAETAFSLVYSDSGEAFEFADQADALKHVAARQSANRAKAVLEALREPTHAMLVAASQSRSGSGLGIWQAMIDAALAEGRAADAAPSSDWVITPRTGRDAGLNDDATADRRSREANG